uniref:Uncharacterized protein n=1 Tax=Eptatretus burgeri TaxID=7764 RepID=A0A8C4N3K1_EPTBU
MFSLSGEEETDMAQDEPSLGLPLRFEPFGEGHWWALEARPLRSYEDYGDDKNGDVPTNYWDAADISQGNRDEEKTSKGSGRLWENSGQMASEWRPVTETRDFLLLGQRVKRGLRVLCGPLRDYWPIPDMDESSGGLRAVVAWGYGGPAVLSAERPQLRVVFTHWSGEDSEASSHEKHRSFFKRGTTKGVTSYPSTIDTGRRVARQAEHGQLKTARLLRNRFARPNSLPKVKQTPELHFDNNNKSRILWTNMETPEMIVDFIRSASVSDGESDFSNDPKTKILGSSEASSKHFSGDQTAVTTSKMLDNSSNAARKATSKPNKRVNRDTSDAERQSDGRSPCARLHAFHGLQELRAACRPEGPLRACLAQLDLPAGWFDNYGKSEPLEDVDLFFSEARCTLGELRQRMKFVRSFRATPGDRLRQLGRFSLQVHSSDGANLPDVTEVGLGSGVAVALPAKPLHPGDIFDVTIRLAGGISARQLKLWLCVPHGLKLLAVTPSRPSLWDIEVTRAIDEPHPQTMLQLTRRRPPSLRLPPLEVAQLMFRADDKVKESGDEIGTPEGETQRILWLLLPPNSTVPGREGEDACSWMAEGGAGPWAIGGSLRGRIWGTEINHGLRSASSSGKKGDAWPVHGVPWAVGGVAGMGTAGAWKAEEGPLAGVVVTELTVAHVHLVALAAFAATDELLNTAVLTGRSLSVPLRLLAVASDGHLWDVTHRASCRAPQPDVIKVAADCQAVVLEGREHQGSDRAWLLLSLGRLSAVITLRVWFPQFPLRLALSDGHLSSIKGWHIPHQEPTQDDQRPWGCGLQSQQAMLRVWTRLTAGPKTFAPGPNWLVDVTHLIKGHVRTAEPRTAHVMSDSLDGDLVIITGVTPGHTAVQVISPISNVVLGERILSVGSDRVFLRGLHSRPITSLQLRLARWPAGTSDAKDGLEGSGPMIRATVQAARTLNQPAQEALVLSWLAFSDGTTSFLGHFPTSTYDLSLASLDDRVVESVLGGANAIVAARGEGQGTFIRTELLLPESCRNLRQHEVFLHSPVRIRVMYTGDGVDIVHNVHGGKNFADSDTEGKAEHIHLPWSNSDVQTPSFPAQTPQREASLDLPPVSTSRPIAPGQEPLVPLSVPQDTSDMSFPMEDPSWGVASPHPLDLDEDYPFGSPSDDSKPTPNAPEAGLTDVQVGLSTLLGVSGLALLLFAANCLVFGLRRQRRWRRQRRGAAGDAGGPGSHEATAPHAPPARNSPPVSLWTVEGNRRLHPHGFAELAL